jgi:drug/metabolite transporter (DMT)-like permease
MNTSVNRVMGTREWALLLTLSVLWGGSFFFSKVALAELPPLTIVLGRVSIAALVLNLVVAATGKSMLLDWRTWRLFAIMGLLNNLIPFSLIFWGQTQIPSGLASILNATTPLWTTLLAHFLTTDERLTSNRLLGVVCGIVGAVILIGPDALAGVGLNVLAQIAVLGAAISYAFAGIFGKRFRALPPLVTATGQLSATSIMMIPIALIADKPWQLAAPQPITIAAILGLALLSTAIAYIIYFQLLASAGATNLLLVTFLIPVSALLLGITILGERLNPGDFIGMAMIGLGLAAIDGRLVKFVLRSA